MRKENWTGPLADACEGMSVGAIMDALGYKSAVMVENLMRDEDAQRRIPVNRLNGLHAALNEAGKRIIERELYQLA